MSGFCEPPPQDQPNSQMTWSRLHDWLFRMVQFLCGLFPIPIINGGTGQTTAQTAINALTQVTSATAGYVLTKSTVTGNADWEPGGGGAGLVNSVSSSDAALTVSPTTGAVVAATNNFVGDSGSGGVHGVVPAPAAGDAAAGKFLKADGTWTAPPSGTGTVTSVALTVPTEFSVSGSPITTSGTLAVTKANETANTVWAGPTSGGAAAPTFRALVSADLPGGTGTVSSIATTAPITGGTITTTGTIGVTDFVASGASHARGTVPDPGNVAGTTKFLREDASWALVGGSSGGGLILLASYAPTNVLTQDVTSVLSSTYDIYLIELDDMINVTNSTNLNVQVSVDNGVSWIAGTNYVAANFRSDSGFATSAGGSSGAANFTICAGQDNTSANQSSATTLLIRNANSAIWKTISIITSTWWTSSSIMTSRTGACVVKATGAINALRFQYSSGNISSGIIKIYAIANS